jgi:hypothetical protein
MTNNPINALNKWLSLTITLGNGSFPYSWLLSKKLSYVGKYLSSCMKVSAKNTAGGIYVSASSWQDPPQGPPHFFN